MAETTTTQSAGTAVSLPKRSRVKRVAIIALLLGALAAIVWTASLPRALGPAEGTTLDGQSPDAKVAEHRSFRIGTFNIHGCTGADDRRDVGRVAKTLRDLDFVALEEVHGPRLWEDGDQAAQLGQRLKLAWLFAPNTRTWGCLDFGNGLLSRLPVAWWQRIPLESRGGRGFRNAVLVDLPWSDGRTIHVLLTHITRSDDSSREEQLRAVVDLYLALAEPSILLGDLNSDAADPEIRRLMAAPGVVDAVGRILGDKSPPRIDWIFLRGLKCTDAGLRDEGASDHPMAWAEVE